MDWGAGSPMLPCSGVEGDLVSHSDGTLAKVGGQKICGSALA